jgi:hypothetical protein
LQNYFPSFLIKFTENLRPGSLKSDQSQTTTIAVTEEPLIKPFQGGNYREITSTPNKYGSPPSVEVPVTTGKNRHWNNLTSPQKKLF